MPEYTDGPIRRLDREGASPAVRIKVVGVGGGGNNAVNRMIEAGVIGVEFVAINTDVQALQTSRAPARLQLGKTLTLGRGTGGDADLGSRAALADSEKIIEALEGADLVIVTAGLGGGAGTGGAPVVASFASGMGALTIALVTRPFHFEGRRRILQAERGLEHLLDAVDSLIVIPNDKLLAAAGNTGFFESFRIADDVLRQTVQCITDLIAVPGVINRDFADLKSIMAGMGHAVMATAVRAGPNRAVEAARAAMASPLVEVGAISGARGILINVSGSSSLKLSEVNEASKIIQAAGHEDANIIFGAVLDERLGEEIKITLIAAGFHDSSVRREREAPAQAAISASIDHQSDPIGDPLVDYLHMDSALPNEPSPGKKEEILDRDQCAPADIISTLYFEEANDASDQKQKSHEDDLASEEFGPIVLEGGLAHIHRAAVAAYAALAAEPAETPSVLEPEDLLEPKELTEPRDFAGILQRRLENLDEQVTPDAVFDVAEPVEGPTSGDDETDVLPAVLPGAPAPNPSFESILHVAQAEVQQEIQAPLPADEADILGHSESGYSDDLFASLFSQGVSPDQETYHEEVQEFPERDAAIAVHGPFTGMSAPGESEMQAQGSQFATPTHDVADGRPGMAESWNGIGLPTRFSPFAGAVTSDEDTGEMDELDIPAFLRRGTEQDR